MNFPLWSVFNPGYQPDTGNDELQTDVMRFMAILGFCLVAIFAMVQTLPLQPQDSRPELETAARLQQQIRDLEQQLTALKQEADKLQATLSPLRQEEQQVRERLGVMTRELENQQQRLKHLNADLREGNQALASLKRQLQVQYLELQERQQRFHHMQLELMQIPEQAEFAQQPPPTVQSEAESKLPPETPAPPESVGFNLRLASDQALITLLQKEEVQLYAMVRKTTWQISPQNGALRLRTRERPPLFHEMTRETVPNKLKALIQQRAVFDPDRVTWGLVLPASIRKQINQLMNTHQSGVLVIGSDGRVRREDN